MSTQAQLWMMLRLDKSLRSYGEEGSGLKPRELLQVRHAAASFRKVSLVPPTGHRLSSNDCKTMCQKARAVNFSSHIQSCTGSCITTLFPLHSRLTLASVRIVRLSRVGRWWAAGQKQIRGIICSSDCFHNTFDQCHRF